MSNTGNPYDRLVLFDIDGTLLFTHGAGRRAITRALIDELGTAGPIDSTRFDGKTDPQIVMELMEAADHPSKGDRSVVAAVCERYADLLEGELATAEVQIEVLPGVLQLLDALEDVDGILLGLLTGNVARGARFKLVRGGIDPARFRVGAFGSDEAERSMLPPIAARRAADLMGRIPAGDEVVIVGDTPADITCGVSISARAVGVATGSYSREELNAAGAYRTLADFSDVSVALEAILD